MIGFAAMRGRGWDEDPQLLVFWDGKPGLLEEPGIGRIMEVSLNEPLVIDAMKS